MNAKDKLSCVHHERVALTAMSLLNGMQNHRPEAQVAGVAATLMLLCDVLGLDPRFELERSQRIMKDADRNLRAEFKAVRAYIEGELKNV